MALSEVTRDAVLKAIAEFEALGRTAFLDKYGFGRARSYFVLHNGRHYDSKAVLGAAHGFSFAHALGPSDFNGGLGQTAPALERLGFEVVSYAQALTPIVLVENERTAGGRYDHWKDATGERYQYPNQYKNRVVEGRPFVYYRGARRADGRRGTPEYFGHGVIGEVHQDPDTDEAQPKREWKWYCDIAEYSPFPKPVPFREGDASYENISQNQWSVAVRDLAENAYEAILAAAGLSANTRPYENERPPDAPSPMPSIEDVVPRVTTSEELLLPTKRAAAGAAGKRGGHAARRSRFSKRIGDRGERVVLKLLKATLSPTDARTLRWVASDGETPGWDIEYRQGGELWGVEVKATTGSAMPSIELTANEWVAAESLGARYRVALVADALGKEPTVEFVDNIFARASAGEFEVSPLSWRVERPAR